MNHLLISRDRIAASSDIQLQPRSSRLLLWHYMRYRKIVKKGRARKIAGVSSALDKITWASLTLEKITCAPCTVPKIRTLKLGVLARIRRTHYRIKNNLLTRFPLKDEPSKPKYTLTLLHTPLSKSRIHLSSGRKSKKWSHSNQFKKKKKILMITTAA